MAISEETRALRRLGQIEVELLPVIRAAIRRVNDRIASSEHLPSSSQAEAELATITAAVTNSGLRRLRSYWTQEVEKSILPAVLRAMLRSADVVQRWLPQEVREALDFTNRDEIAEGLLEQIALVLNDIGETMLAEAMTAMQRAFERGEGAAKAAARVRRALDISEDRAVVIARTTATQVANIADELVSQEVEAAGFEHELEWLATNDARTREEHREANGQRIKPGEQFSLYEDNGTIHRLRFPGDPTAAPHMTVNCRCTTLIRLSGE